jgi:hypothetical protein
MRLRVSVGFGLLIAMPCAAGTFTVIGAQPGAWPAILSSVGHIPAAAGQAETADILVATAGTPASADWQKRVNEGAALILEGSSPLAASFGFRARIASGGAESVSIIHLVDRHNPGLPVIWEKALELPRYDTPAGATIFAQDRWSSEPLVAGMRSGAGAVLWVAVNPGATGYERFPYLMQALSDLGFAPAFRASRLWAFFDYSYRSQADPDYLAERWRKAGVSALHVASWHFYESDAGRDEYLKRLIEACHRHGVLVYAWIELPHVSERFWDEHPQCREKTALLQDAQLDWRKLMNLQNPPCVDAIGEGLGRMMRRFDWDGVNLAELYFESLEGASNPARFTPLNDDVRAQFAALEGWDPIEIWSKHNDLASLRKFLDFRAGLARRMQEQWLGRVEKYREFLPGLDLVLTHVDDQFDKGMKDSIGAEAARVLPLLDSHAFSFLIEDPATVWNLGPGRYPEIAKRYLPLTSHTEKLAIDINIVDRYQDVYPTKQQTGTELFELVHLASASFARVALYFENSILKPDMGLLAASSAIVTHYSKDRRGTTVESPADIELVWSGGATVDGKSWPMAAAGMLRLPAGMHSIQPAPKWTGLSIVDLNARLKSAGTSGGGRVLFDYASDSRGIVRFDRKPSRLEIDGKETNIGCAAEGECSVLLPRGEHRVVAAG